MDTSSKLANTYRDELLGNIVPFWLKNSNDEQNGGYFTCLDRQGKVYDTDKFLWLQARQVYTFSFLFNHAGEKDLWLGFALQGAGFLKKHGRDPNGNWYFSLDQNGNPLVGPHSIFTDCFAALAFSSIYKATEIEEFAAIARDTFAQILKRRENPKGIYSKSAGPARRLINSSVPMILLMLLEEIGPLIDAGDETEFAKACIDELLTVFYDGNSGLVLENKNIDGSFSNTFDGRLVCVGTIAEGMWFIMDRASKNGNQAQIEKAADILIAALNYGWDQEFGGLFYFQDIKGYPPQQLEWDQKLWWVHTEALTALIKAYDYTGRKDCLDWFKKVHVYAWAHFPDPVYGEWFGYLNRRGEVLLDLKGGKWKGCYHMPRMLYQCWKTFEKLESKGILL